MSDDRLIVAIGRIERALSRIEAASARQADTMLAEFTELFHKHEALRAASTSALERIDRLVDAGSEA